jgi:hypothetical protein
MEAFMNIDFNFLANSVIPHHVYVDHRNNAHRVNICILQQCYVVPKNRRDSNPDLGCDDTAPIHQIEN